MTPLVSVICLCYNQEKFVQQALQSVFDQTYNFIQLIVVDDHSSDRSADAILSVLRGHADVSFLQMPSNLGNCRAFNEALRYAKGKYVVDLAADDVLLPSRIGKGVEVLEARAACGVQFSDAEIIDENNVVLGLHSERFPHHTIPSGDIFADVLARYFINSPTMMMRKAVLDRLGGYDEDLAYEDFDFWVRSSHEVNYIYLPEPLVRRRRLSYSLGKRQHEKGNPQQKSTLMVCEKALALCRNKREFAALRKRALYEARQSVIAGSFETAWSYLKLWGASIKSTINN